MKTMLNVNWEIDLKALSLFNGISGLHLALDRAGIEVDTLYYAEIDKFANKVTETQYPNDIPLGDVTKFEDWVIDWGSVDLVTAGFPCQSWSVAGQGLGDKDERGMLFWTTLEIMSKVLRHNPKAKFMLENVKMKKEFEEYITYHTSQALGEVTKTLINSALVSAQNRNRYYWTNFEVSQPADLGLLLSDIVENSGCVNSKYWYNKDFKYNGDDVKIQAVVYFGKYEMNNRVYNLKNKSPTLTTCRGGHLQKKVYQDGKCRKLTPLEYERLQTVPDNFTETLSDSQRYNTLGNGWTIDVIAHILKCANLKKGG